MVRLRFFDNLKVQKLFSTKVQLSLRAGHARGYRPGSLSIDLTAPGGQAIIARGGRIPAQWKASSSEGRKQKYEPHS
jgi:hypothetical protein